MSSADPGPELCLCYVLNTLSEWTSGSKKRFPIIGQLRSPSKPHKHSALLGQGFLATVTDDPKARRSTAIDKPPTRLANGDRS